MRRSLSLLAVALVATACVAAPQAGTTTTTAPVASPEEVVAGWLGAITAGDFAATGDLVDEVSLALMIGAENPLDMADLAAMLTDGVGPVARTTYWETFRSDFVVFSGVAIGDLRVDGEEEFTVGNARFAAVTVTGGDRTTEILCRRGDDLVWRVDLVASLGPPLVRALRTLVVTVPPGDDGDVVRRAFFTRVAASLRAGAERAPGADLPEPFRIELEALIGYLETAR